MKKAIVKHIIDKRGNYYVADLSDKNDPFVTAKDIKTITALLKAKGYFVGKVLTFKN